MDSFFGSEVVQIERIAYRNIQRALEIGDIEQVLGWAYITLTLRSQIGGELLRKVESGDIFGVFELLRRAAGVGDDDN